MQQDTCILHLHETDLGLQKVGFGAVAFALYPLDSPEVH